MIIVNSIVFKVVKDNILSHKCRMLYKIAYTKIAYTDGIEHRISIKVRH